MACPRGNATPNQNTKLRLFSDSAGFCQKPDCQRALFVDVGDSRLHIAEMAHVFAASDKGPRTNSALSGQERSSYENLILLCPSCHAIVDKAPDWYPDTLMTQWKREHVELIAEMFGAVRYASRRAAHEAIKPLLAANLSIFVEYGPDNQYRYNPESELADVWQRKVLSQIIPNNRKIIAIVDRNRCHLKGQEDTTLEEFRQHVEDLESRHVGDREATVGRRFPAAMNAMLS